MLRQPLQHLDPGRPDGQIVGKYRKVHLPGHADHRRHPLPASGEALLRGGQPRLSGVAGVRRIVGMMICNDRRWPEAYRVMGLQGAELILLGYNTPTYNIYHPEPWHLRMFHNRLVVQWVRTRTAAGWSRPPRRARRTATA